MSSYWFLNLSIGWQYLVPDTILVPRQLYITSRRGGTQLLWKTGLKKSAEL